MKRILAFLFIPVALFAIAAGQRFDFVAWGPAKLLHGSGMVETGGVTANTDAARGAAAKTLWNNSTAGDALELEGNATSDFSPRKNGVRLIRKPNAVYTNTANVPNIDIDSLSTANRVIYRGRQAYLYCPENVFCLWNYPFDTQSDYANTVFSSGGPTLTVAGGTGTYAASAGATSAAFIGSPRFPTAQYCCRVLIDSHNAPGSGATYNDVLCGFALTTTSTSDTVQYKFGAIYRRTEALNQIFLHYDWSGGSPETTPVTITETQPFYLVYIINHNSATAAIERLDGTWKIVDHQEITLAHADMEDQATVAKMRPLLYFQSNGGQSTTLKDWSVRCMGSLGEREHMVCRYEDGEPIKSPDGYYYISCDDIGPNTASTATNGPNTAFMRCNHSVHLYDATTGRFVGTTAKHSMKVSGRVFGTQEGYFMHDRNTGLWHAYFSEWNYSGGGAVKLYHGSSYENLLTCGHKVWEEGELTQIDLSALSGFSGAALYSSNVRKINGTWYHAGIVTSASTPTRRVYLISDDNPEFSSPALVWKIPDGAADAYEGGYLWHVGSNWYVSVGKNSNNINCYGLLTGTQLYTHAFPGGGSYEQFMDLLEVVKGGKTQYQFISFSDTDDGGPGRNEDFYDGTANNNLAFGSRIVIDGGTFDGEQYTETAK